MDARVAARGRLLAVLAPALARALDLCLGFLAFVVAAVRVRWLLTMRTELRAQRFHPAALRQINDLFNEQVGALGE